MRKVVCFAAIAALTSVAFGQVAINEVDYNGPGTDMTEWIELTGAAGTDLTGWTIKLYNQGAEYAAYPLTGSIPNDFSSPWGGDGGFYVMGIFDATTAAVFGAPDYTPAGWVSDEIQNGPNDSIVLFNNLGAVVDEWEYDSDTPGSNSILGFSQAFGDYDGAGTAGDITTYQSLGRLGYSYDEPIFVFDDPQAQLGVVSWNYTFDHDLNIAYSGTGPAWTSPAYTGAAFTTVGPYTEAATGEIQYSGTSAYGANRGLTPGTFNNAYYGAGGQDPYTINIVPEPASLLLLALGALALRRR